MRTAGDVQTYRVTVDFEFDAEVIPGDPTDLEELSDMELPEVYEALKTAFPRIDPESVNLDVEALPNM